MAEQCNNDCSSCGKDCESRKSPNSMRIFPHQGTNIKHIIAVISGKGGVGKSSVTAALAVSLSRLGYKTAILDADITGPSIPKAFGVNVEPERGDDFIYAVPTKTGIKMMSINLLMEDESEPVIWRGPIIAGAVKQFYTDVVWGDIDYMLVDCPPGTGDVPLTIFQSLPVDGVVVVTTPQDLVSMIVGKAVKMADDMGVRILGLVENMSYFKCPDCGKEYNIFGNSKLDEIKEKFYIDDAIKLPINPGLAELMDQGKAEDIKEDELDEFAKLIVEKNEI